MLFSPPLPPSASGSSPHQAEEKHAEGRQSGEPRGTRSHTQTTADLLGTRRHVCMDSRGPPFPVTALSALTGAKARAAALLAPPSPPSISQPGSGGQDGLRLLSARRPGAETELIHLPR